jgi:hypothetical protein
MRVSTIFERGSRFTKTGVQVFSRSSPRPYVVPLSAEELWPPFSTNERGVRYFTRRFSYRRSTSFAMLKMHQSRHSFLNLVPVLVPIPQVVEASNNFPRQYFDAPFEKAMWQCTRV